MSPSKSSKYKATTVGGKGGRHVRQHVLIAERILGRRLQGKECVHHINGDGRDNTRTNLVICQDLTYHNLLEYRARAYRACGLASAVQCRYCKVWTDREGMVKYNDLGWHHRECHNDYNRKRNWR